MQNIPGHPLPLARATPRVHSRGGWARGSGWLGAGFIETVLAPNDLARPMHEWGRGLARVRGSNLQIAGRPDARCIAHGGLCSITSDCRIETFRTLLAPHRNTIILQGQMRQKCRCPAVPAGARGRAPVLEGVRHRYNCTAFGLRHLRCLAAPVLRALYLHHPGDLHLVNRKPVPCLILRRSGLSVASPGPTSGFVKVFLFLTLVF